MHSEKENRKTPGPSSVMTVRGFIKCIYHTRHQLLGDTLRDCDFDLFTLDRDRQTDRQTETETGRQTDRWWQRPVNHVVKGGGGGRGAGVGGGRHSEVLNDVI